MLNKAQLTGHICHAPAKIKHDLASRLDRGKAQVRSLGSRSMGLCEICFVEGSEKL
jgi:hypothetical protein